MQEGTFDNALVEFLRWCSPLLGLRYAGFRKVRGQVGKRIRLHLAESGLEAGSSGLVKYRQRLESIPMESDEWRELDHLCRVTISRFYRDGPVFDLVRDRVLPVLLARARRKKRGLRFWSAGCASGEEPWTLSIIGRICFPTVPLQIVGTDVDRAVLERARCREYPESSLQELPEGWRELAFETAGESGEWKLLEEFASSVSFEVHDVRSDPLDDGFDMVFCRNLAFTYFSEDVQREVAATLRSSLREGGALVLGGGEALPDETAGFEGWFETWGIWRRTE